MSDDDDDGGRPRRITAGCCRGVDDYWTVIGSLAVWFDGDVIKIVLLVGNEAAFRGLYAR